MISTDISKGLVVSAINRADANSAPRSTGIHVSSIIKHAALMLRIIKEESEDEESLIYTDGGLVVLPGSLNRICIGLAWEEWLAKHVTVQEGGVDITFHPGEFELDGIAGSPDAIEVSVVELDALDTSDPVSEDIVVVSEFKFTWKTERRFDDWMWMCQIKAYCKLVGTRFAKLHVMFVNSDYKPPIPSYRVWALEFTQLEIEENWRMLRTHAIKHLGLKMPKMTRIK